MAGGYSRKSESLSSATSVGASANNTLVSKSFAISADDSLNFLAYVQCSALVHAAGITFKLQHSPDGASWVDVGSSAQAASAAAKSFSCGTAEVSTLTFPAKAGATDGDYISITDRAGNVWAVALDTTGGAAQTPSGAVWTAIAAARKVYLNVSATTDEASVAAAVEAGFNALTGFTAVLTLDDTAANGTMTVTQVSAGAVANPVPKSYDDAGAGSIVLTSTDTAGSDGDVSISANTITETSHGWLTGQPVYVTGADLPAGLTTGTVYYIIKTSANAYSLAASAADADAGTAVDLTDFGSGTGSAIVSGFTIRMLATDSTDVAQLPLWDVCRIVADSGAGDSATVSAVYRAARL